MPALGSTSLPVPLTFTFEISSSQAPPLPPAAPRIEDTESDDDDELSSDDDDNGDGDDNDNGDGDDNDNGDDCSSSVLVKTPLMPKKSDDDDDGVKTPLMPQKSDDDDEDDGESTSSSDEDSCDIKMPPVTTTLMPQKCSSLPSKLQVSAASYKAPIAVQSEIFANKEETGDESAADSGGVARKKLMTKLLCIDDKLVNKRKTTEQDFDEVMFASLMRPGKVFDVLFHREIRQRAKRAGMKPMSNETLEKYVYKKFGLNAFKPSKTINGKRKQARGFKNIRFAKVPRKIKNENGEGASKRIKTESMPTSFSSVLTSMQAGPVSNNMSTVQSYKTLVMKPQQMEGGGSLWQQGVMLTIKKSLGVSVLAHDKEGKHVKNEGIVGVGIVISKDRDGSNIINGVVPGTSAALLGGVEIGEKLTYVNDTAVIGKTTDELRTMLMGKYGTQVALTTTPSLRTVTMMRTLPVVKDIVAAPLDKIFFYGGTQEDRDICIGRLLSEQEAYFVDDPTQNNLLKIVQVYSKSMLPKLLVVVKYEETFATAESTTANKETHKEAYAVARCLLKGYFWDENRGHVVLDSPAKMFVFCNEQPYHRAEWEGWTFYNVNDREA